MEEGDVSVFGSSIDDAHCTQPHDTAPTIPNSAEEIPKAKTQVVMPKPIMVSEIENVINCAAKIEVEIEQNFR